MILRDVQTAFHALLRQPGYAAAAVATLALGIGANTAIFSVISSVLLQPLPFPQAESLVTAFELLPDGSIDDDFSYLEYEEWERRNRVFSALAAHCETSGTLGTPENGASYAVGARTSRTLWDVLGVKPQAGRGFTEEEDREGGPEAIILSHRLWMSRFGGDSAALGKTIDFGERVHTIIGIMPAGLRFPSQETDFWIPLRGNEMLTLSGISRPNYRTSWLSLVGRLKPGIDLAAAQREAQRMDDEVAQEQSLKTRSMRVLPLREALVGDTRPILRVLLAAVGLVLLIACANVANLSLVRTMRRQRDLALRSALGASRKRILRQTLAESGVIALGGAAVGVALAAVLLTWLSHLESSWIARQEDIGLNLTALGMTIVLSTLAAGVCGIAPAVRATRSDPQLALRVGARGLAGPSRGGRRFQQMLSIVQCSLALILLVAAGLLTNSFLRLISVPVGFDPDQVVVAQLELPEHRYPDGEDVSGFYRRLVEDLRGLPGVEQASFSQAVPFMENHLHVTIVPEGTEPDPENRFWVGMVIVDQAYFRTMHVGIREGRGIEMQDAQDGPPVAVINQTMAERMWPGQSPLGKRIRFTGGVSGTLQSVRYLSKAWKTVVGVVPDERREGFEQLPQMEFYIPHTQMPWPAMTLVLRGNASGSLSESIRRTIAMHDSGLALQSVETLRHRMNLSVFDRKFRTQLIGLFAALACLLSVIGVYSVVAFGIAHRTREIGVRMALGAQRSRVLKLVLGQGLLLSGIGMAFGLAGSLAMGRALSSMLFEVKGSDPLTMAAACGALLIVSLGATYLPARRASRIDPVASLRES